MEPKTGPRFLTNFIESINLKRKLLDNAEKGILYFKIDGIIMSIQIL